MNTDKKIKKEEIKKQKIEIPVQKKEKEIEEKLGECKKMFGDLQAKYFRLLADYQNLEKRFAEEREQMVQYANKHFILKLLPFLDNLEKAEIFITDNGLKIIKEQFEKIIRDEGIEEILVLGKEFDPHIAEVVDIVKGEKNNIVCEVLRKGYQYKGAVLQVAQVKVTKKS